MSIVVRVLEAVPLRMLTQCFVLKAACLSALL